MPSAVALPACLHLFERGWLSANNYLFLGGPQGTAIVDTGYGTHAEQTVALVDATLREHGQAPLARILNTHLHSDHCGGNAALQARWPGVATCIPPGEADAVARWDEAALSYQPTGQNCPRFGFTGLLQPGTSVWLGDAVWEVHAAPGHDPHSVILFEPQARLLISADALWENGFGVVFPEIEGVQAFDAVAATLDLIESLQPTLVLPGHGPRFTDVAGALAVARRRLEGFARDPRKHAQYAAKVLLKYKLLEWQHIALDECRAWTAGTPYFRLLHERHFNDRTAAAWADELVQALVQSQAAEVRDGVLHNR